MKKLNSFFIVLLFSPICFAQPQAPDTLWTRTFGGSEWEEGFCVQQTNDGGYIIVGYSNTFGIGGYDVYLIKTDGQGNQQWYQTFGGGWDDWGNSVQQNSDGGFIIAGTTSSYGAGSGDFYLVKTDSVGNQQWYSTFGGSNEDLDNSVQQTTDGGYIIAGTTSSYGSFSDVYLVKTDSVGNQQWYRTFGGSSSDEGYSVQQTGDGGYVITGQTLSYGAGWTDVYLVKTDSVGNLQWYHTFGGSDYDVGRSVQHTADGEYIIAGTTSSYGSFSDVYLVKTDSVGNYQWYRTFGGSNEDFGNSVQQTSDGGYIIAGMTYSYGAGSFDVYFIRVESEVEQLSISLTPVNPPIIIPVGGGSFQFTAVIDNLGPGPVVFDKWCNVSVPGMPNPMKIQLSEQNYLSTSGNIIHTLTQFVPGSAPAGTYTYLGFVGEYPNFIVDCDSFTFEKSATGSGFNQSPGWMVEGWDGSKDSSFSLSPLAFSLLSIFPNPFNAETSIKFELSNSNLISLAIYNIEGKEVEKLAEGWQEAGSYEIKFDASNLPSGLYFARLKAENFEQTQKLLLIK